MSSVNTKNPSHKATGIFINYRQADTAGQAGRLHEALVARFRGPIFMDIHTIEAGQDFIEVIQNALRNCKVLLAIIGDQWATITNSAGQRRLDDPDDFVRIEIAEALKRDIYIIPVLVERASMPRKEELPPDLTNLFRHHAIELSERNWTRDVEHLVEVLKKLGVDEKPKNTWKIVTAIAAVVALIALVLIGNSLFFGCNQSVFKPPIIKGTKVYLVSGKKKFEEDANFIILRRELTDELRCAGFEVHEDYSTDPNRHDQPEIRYFNDDAPDQANELAKSMRERLNNSQFPPTHQTVSEVLSAGYTEIWFGR